MTRLLASIALIVLSLAWTPSICAQDGTLVLAERTDPIYPPLARVAHIQGEVEVQFRVDSDGRTADVKAVSGHPMLVGTAEDAVKEWRFSELADQSATSAVQLATFRFSIEEPPEATPYGAAVAYTGLESDSPEWSRVLVTGNCRTPNNGAMAPPNREDTGPVDYVELRRSDPSYSVRIYRTGFVQWEGFYSVRTLATAGATIDPASASQLLDEMLASPYWSMCTSYAGTVLHGSTDYLDVAIGGVRRSVADYARSGPTILRELMDRVDAVADTHQWRHGDPLSEPLSNITLEHPFRKPGITDLMLAAADGKENRVAKRLAVGAIVEATDASGWTALMYAAANYYDHGARTGQLVAAGADPNHRDAQGHTALMAGAMGARRFRGELVDAGADVNDQSDSGITALMILAARAGTGGRITLGGDKGYDDRELIKQLRGMGVTPHVAQNLKQPGGSAIDSRTTRHVGYAVSQRKRKRVEEVFGWMKTVGLLRKLRHRGHEKVDWMFTFAAAAYNLVRLRTLLAAPAT